LPVFISHGYTGQTISPLLELGWELCDIHFRKETMLKSCKYCGRIHDSKFDCGRKPKKKNNRHSGELVRYTSRMKKKSSVIWIIIGMPLTISQSIIGTSANVLEPKRIV